MHICTNKFVETLPDSEECANIGARLDDELCYTK